MEYIGLLNKIDSESIHESWIQALIRIFNFPEDPSLFPCLKALNDRIGTFGSEKDSPEMECDCCSLPPLNDAFWWTRYLSFDDTRAVVINSTTPVLSYHPSEYETRWAEQGVFFINNYVKPTCRENRGHTAWEAITNGLIQYMVNNNPSVFFLLHGSSSCVPIPTNPSKVLQIEEGLLDVDSGSSGFLRRESDCPEDDQSSDDGRRSSGRREAEDRLLSLLFTSRH